SSKIESKHPCKSWVPLKKGMHRNNKRGLAHEVAIVWNWSRELFDNVIQRVILGLFASVLLN
nr:hypothetical protein [Tanacetum cinerariifolium]GFA35946.1 hypothetical protein [Tanacetum cinerariifolium]